jgi:hypothetical protein
MRLNDLTGKRFGRLVVQSIAPKTSRQTRWVCKCDCGNIVIVFGSNLTHGLTKSCKCLHKQVTSKINSSHGMTNTRLFHIWTGIIQRCTNKNSPSYKNYGGRGISVCNEWHNSFLVFCNWAVSNGYSDDLTIDRINNDGNYESSNCRWATGIEQGGNRRDNHRLTFNNKTMTIAEWAREIGIPMRTLWKRLNDGESIESALTRKLKKHSVVSA